MKLYFIVEVDVEHTAGKFVSKDALAELIIAEIDDPGEIVTDDEATYEVTSWEVTHEEPRPT